jgi:hypothetical protein
VRLLTERQHRRPGPAILLEEVAHVGKRPGEAFATLAAELRDGVDRSAVAPRLLEDGF